MSIQELEGLLKSKKRIWRYFWDVMENDSASSKEMRDKARKQYPNIDKEFESALIDLFKAYQPVKKILKRLEKFSDKH